MTMESLNTAAAIGTFLVIAATAIAAIVQLRHLRASNELNALLTTLTIWDSPAFQEWANFVRVDLAREMDDPAFRAGLEAKVIDRAVHREMNMCDYWEQLGAYAKHGLLPEKTFMDVASDTVSYFWEILAPAIAIIRRRRGPSAFENFEYLAARGRAWLVGHPEGAYPKRMARLPIEDKWAAADAAVAG